MLDSATTFIQSFEKSVFAAAGKNAKFSFKFTGGFDFIDFGPSKASAIQSVAIRVTKGTPLTFQHLPKYKERVSWAGNEKVSPVEAVFILSNVSQDDSLKYICKVTKGAPFVVSREVQLIVTGKRLYYNYKGLKCPKTQKFF